MTSIHPFDVFELSKGEWISPDRCEAALGVKRDHPRYQLRLISLCELITKQWESLRDEVVTIRCEKDGVKICTDDEAVEVNANRRERHVRGLGRTQVRQTGVDVSKLSTRELREKHSRECVVGAAFLLGGRERQQVALKEYQRRTPPMLKK